MSYSHENRRQYKAYPEIILHDIAIVEGKEVILVPGHVKQNQALREYPKAVRWVGKIIALDGTVLEESQGKSTDAVTARPEYDAWSQSAMEKYRKTQEELEADKRAFEARQPMTVADAVAVGDVFEGEAN